MDDELRAVGLRGCVRVLLPHNRGEAWPTVAEAADKLRHTLGGLDGTLQLGVWIPEEDKKEFDGALLATLGRLRHAMLDCPLFFQMHLAESKKRKEACQHALTRLLENGLAATPAAARTIFVHVIWLDSEELSTLIALRESVGVITCPKFADGRIAPIKELLRGGVPVGLGSDVAAPDPFSLIGTLMAVHRSREESLHLSIGEAFNIATLQGARVFGLQRQIGSIEEGKDADIVLLKNPAAIDPELFLARPGDDEPAAYQERVKVIERLFTRSIIRREHVDRVIVRGRVVVEGGSVVSRQHEEAIEAAGRKTALTVVRRLRNGRK
jgi:cytosine/adenosine deaminase-related metal-dependent hydrolase